MSSESQLRSRVAELLEGKLDLEEFEDWFLANNWNAHLYADADNVRVVHAIEGALLDFSSDAINEQLFREELASAVRPFAESAAPNESDMKPYVIVENDRAEAPPTAFMPASLPQRLGGPGEWEAGPCAPGFKHVEVQPRFAAKAVEFLTHPTWRAYLTCYVEGLPLCRAFVDGDPARFDRLLSEQLTPDVLAEQIRLDEARAAPR